MSNLRIAVIMAFGFHLLLLSIKLTFSQKANVDKTDLEIRFELALSPVVKVTDGDVDNTKIEFEESFKKALPTQPRKSNHASQLITSRQKPLNKNKDKIEISRLISSADFKQFLKKETDQHTEQNIKSLKEFDQTFKPYFEAKEIAQDIVNETGELGGGLYKIRKNGKVYCQFQTTPQSLDDQEYRFPAIQKDCSIKEKFDLNLRENTLN